MLSNCNFTVSKLADGLGIKRVIPIQFGIENSGGKPGCPLFYKNPQYIIRAASSNNQEKQIALRAILEGPADCLICLFVTHPGHKGRVLEMTKDIQIVKSEKVMTMLIFRPIII